jgi:replicative DNA helicase
MNDYKIEERILSSFLQDNIVDIQFQQKALSFLHTLKVDDFSNFNYQEIFKVLIKLDEKNNPLSEPFILEYLDKKYHDSYLQILATLPDVRIEENIKLLKIKSTKRNLKKSIIPLMNDQDIDPDKIVQQLLKLQEVESKTVNRDFDDTFNNYLDKFDLDPKQMEELKFEYIYEKFIVKNELTMIAAKPGSGKSLTTVAISNSALENNYVDGVLYFDLDNSLTTLKQRNIDQLKIIHGKKFRYFHSSFASKQEIWRLIRQLQCVNLTNKLVVFDSAKNFMTGGDRDKNKDVSKLTEVFKSLRDKGATVIFLHHTNKPSKDLEELVYAGSSAWEEDASNAYILHHNEHKNAFIFKPFKARVGELEEIAFEYIANSHSLKKLDINDAIETEEDEEIRNEIISYIKGLEHKPNYSEIMVHLLKNQYSKNKSNAVLQRGKGKYWIETKLQTNNKSIYSLVSKKPFVVEYISPEIKINSDKSDKSGKSILWDSSIRISDKTSPDRLDKQSHHTRQHIDNYENRQNYVDMPSIL